MATIFSTLLSAFFNWALWFSGMSEEEGIGNPAGSTPYMAYTGMCRFRVQVFTSRPGDEVVILWVCPKGIVCMIDSICLMNFVCTSSSSKQ